MAPLPFSRLTMTPTSKALHFPSGRSPRAWWRTNSCHGSSTSPAIRASSTASAPEDETASGRLETLGNCAPTARGTLSAEVIELVPVLHRRHLLAQAGHRLSELPRAHALARGRVPGVV